MQDGCHDLPQSFSMCEGEPHDFQRVHHRTVVVSVVDRCTLQHSNQNNITLKTKNICSNEYTVSHNSKVKKISATICLYSYNESNNVAAFLISLKKVAESANICKNQSGFESLQTCCKYVSHYF